MRERLRDHTFIVGCCVYLLFITIAFVLGRLHLDADGASFIPTFLLTLPWSFILTLIHLPKILFSALTVFHDLPLFLLSAALNVVIAALLRRLVVATDVDHSNS